MEEKVYSAALKLRGTDEVLEKLIESGTLDILSDVIQEVKKTESESKNQLKVLMSLMIDEISAQKSSKSIKKLRLSEQISEEPGRSITARSTQMLTSARSCEFSRASFITRRPSAEVVSEFSQSKGHCFAKAPRDPPNYNIAPGPGTYNPSSVHKDKTPIALFGKSSRPEHFVKPVCQEIYNPLHYFASRPLTRRD